MIKYVACFFDEANKGYVLVNGWNKEQKFFTHEISECNLFDSVKTLKTSITKMRKIGVNYQLGYEKDRVFIDKLVFVIKDNVRYLDHIERLEQVY